MKNSKPSEAKEFKFTEDNYLLAMTIIAKYPTGRAKSAILPLLDIAQRQNGGFLNIKAIEYVANLLDMPYMRAYEVASFYSMFNLEPVGKYHIQICGTTPCMLRGSQAIIDICKKSLNLNLKQTSADGLFTLSEVECLGACINAPVVQINDDYYEDLNEDGMIDLISQMKAGKKIEPKKKILKPSSIS